MAVPTSGISEAAASTVPQNSAGMPTIQNAIIAATPCASAVMPVPQTTAWVTSRTRCNSASSWLRLSGSNRRA